MKSMKKQPIKKGVPGGAKGKALVNRTGVPVGSKADRSSKGVPKGTTAGRSTSPRKSK